MSSTPCLGLVLGLPGTGLPRKRGRPPSKGSCNLSLYHHSPLGSQPGSCYLVRPLLVVFTGLAGCSYPPPSATVDPPAWGTPLRAFEALKAQEGQPEKSGTCLPLTTITIIVVGSDYETL